MELSTTEELNSLLDDETFPLDAKNKQGESAFMKAIRLKQKVTKVMKKYISRTRNLGLIYYKTILLYYYTLVSVNVHLTACYRRFSYYCPMEISIHNTREAL